MGHRVNVLIDIDRSHNIMQPCLAKHLQLRITLTPSFLVMIGDGNHIYCTGLCPQVSLTMQSHAFRRPFYQVSFHGADLALGI